MHQHRFDVPVDHWKANSFFSLAHTPGSTHYKNLWADAKLIVYHKANDESFHFQTKTNNWTLPSEKGYGVCIGHLLDTTNRQFMYRYTASIWIKSEFLINGYFVLVAGSHGSSDYSSDGNNDVSPVRILPSRQVHKFGNTADNVHVVHFHTWGYILDEYSYDDLSALNLGGVATRANEFLGLMGWVHNHESASKTLTAGDLMMQLHFHRIGAPNAEIERQLF